MLTLSLYDRVKLRLKPPVQRAIADGFLRWDYRKVDLKTEGLDRIPSGAVIYAMNHTDNFNYWPFQYAMHRKFERYTATWVKGKNYEGRVSSTFMKLTNNIPIASRGYVITRDFVDTVGRSPSEDEYRSLRSAVDEGRPVEGEVPSIILKGSRDMLGRHFEPSRESYHEAVEALMDAMMARFIEMNRHALEDIGLDVLVFPQGTRSRRLSRGHIGLAQVAAHLGATIVPVGCSGCDDVYTSRSIITKPGSITYRVGAPIPPDEWRPLAPKSAFVPFSRVAEATHRDEFQAIVDLVMERIDGLVDEPYRFSADRESEGTEGVNRFV